MDTLELDGSIASVCTTTASIAISIASRAGIQVSELRHTRKYIIMHSHPGGGTQEVFGTLQKELRSHVTQNRSFWSNSRPDRE